jgi:hypothetical protein
MKTNNSITVDNIVYLLNQQNYTVEQLTSQNVKDPNRFKFSDYNNFAKVLLDYFFIRYKTIKLKSTTTAFFGATVLINENIKMKWIENFSSIEFYMMYPHITVKLWEKGDIKFNIYEFGTIYKFIVENYKIIKKDPNMTDVSRLLLKYFINFTYGATMNHMKTSFICIDDHEKIVTYSKETLYSLMDKYKDTIFYIDTDSIYLDYIIPEVLSNVKSLGLPFTIQTNLNGMFIEKKKYQIQESGSLRVRGLSRYRSKYKLEKNRINKLQKILNKLNHATNK